MAITTNSTIELVRKYIKELERNNIPIQEVIIFGSQVKGEPKEESDIDIALISSVFTGDRFEDRRRIIPLRRKIDSRIEPIPFRPEDFDHGGVLADEIKRTGKIIINRK
ncbi:nucleotidyltransferase domain-containing protein [bacterium]|nr:nucleotidyltransferase domain-containing protein [bacterium]